MPYPENGAGNQEQAFLDTYNPSDYDLLSISVDTVIFGVDCKVNTENYRKLDEQTLMVLLVKRSDYPFKDMWALPGGFVGTSETLEHAALRVLNGKTGIDGIYLEQLYTFDCPSRDPRMRIISCAYLSLVNLEQLPVCSEGAYAPEWFEVRLSKEEGKLILKSQHTDLSMPIERSLSQNGKISAVAYTVVESTLAFDHADILLTGLTRLQNKVEYSDIVFNLLPERFTITQLQTIYEIILDQKLLAPAFRRKIAGKLTETGQYCHEKGHRPSQYYQYKNNMEA